jgi:hypothetical protein
MLVIKWELQQLRVDSFSRFLGENIEFGEKFLVFIECCPVDGEISFVHLN